MTELEEKISLSELIYSIDHYFGFETKNGLVILGILRDVMVYQEDSRLVELSFEIQPKRIPIFN